MSAAWLRPVDGPASEHLEPERRGIVQLLYAPKDRFRKVILQPGQSMVLSDSEGSDVLLPSGSCAGDRIEIFFDGLCFHVRSLVRGSSFRGHSPDTGFPHDSMVQVGAVSLRLFREASSGLGLPTFQSARDLAAQLRAAAANARLDGVFDTARDDRIRRLLDESIDETAPLYEGRAAAVLDEVAPFLVRFSPASDLLERLLQIGWSQAWGIFLKNQQSTHELRRHLRRFLMVAPEQGNDRLYFRYYDPRVWREFLPLATPRQHDSLLGALTQVLCEGPSGEVLSFQPRSQAEDAPRAEVSA